MFVKMGDSHEIKCHCCRTELEYTQEDIKYRYSQSLDNYIPYIVCPICLQNLIAVDNKTVFC